MAHPADWVRCDECDQFVHVDEWEEHEYAHIHESADPENAAPESVPDQAGTTGTKNHMNGRSDA